MREIVERLQRQVELAKSILEREGYTVSSIYEAEKDTVDKEAAYKEFMQKVKDNATYKKIDALCTKYGYTLYYAVIRHGMVNLSIRSSGSRKDYHPEIYYSNAFGEKDQYFEIQTTAYGSMRIEEYESFLKGCQDAYDLVVELEKIDLNSLYTVTEEK